MNELPTRNEIQSARELVYSVMPPTPQYPWPLLAREVGTTVWMKHENHTPVGAFKVRGGITYVSELLAGASRPEGVIAATRGNHGQSIALAASARDLSVVIVVPEGNSREKNAAMESLGAELVISGHDFQAALEAAGRLATERRLEMVPSYDRRLVQGVATYGWELLDAVPDIDVLYVPIGLGSGFAGCAAARQALNHRTEIVGVVAAGAPCYALSFEAGFPIATEGAETLADGVGCRVPSEEAFAVVRRHAGRVLQVNESEIAEAMRLIYRATHNLAEGAGAVALAGLMQERRRVAGKTVGVVLTGGNVDRELYRSVLAEEV